MKRLLLVVAVGTAALLMAGCAPKYVNPNTPRPSRGGQNASIVVEEFGDFQCPACGAAYKQLKDFPAKYGDKVLWKFLHYPLTSIHPYAFNAAMAAECANDQGKFWEYHNMLYENQNNLSRSDLYTYADKIGLDKTSFDACFRSRAKASVVDADVAEGDKRGVTATPSFFVNGKLVDDWTTLGSYIDSMLTPAIPKAKP